MAFHGGRSRRGGDICAVFVHAGAGYHSVQNEGLHLQACNDAAKAAMAVLRNGGTAVDAVEIAIKILEDREITNAGYGSNLSMEGIVECDAIVVDHLCRSGAVGAVAQIKNPISLARILLDHSTRPLLLKRVPPNFLIGPGATEFAFGQGIPVLPHDALVSPAAKERWLKWVSDLKYAERRALKAFTVPVAQPPHVPERMDPLEEEQVRKKLRTQHTQAMLRGTSSKAESSAAPKFFGSLNDSASNSNVTSDSSGISNEPSDVFSIDLGCEQATSKDSNRNPLINSTQTVPTISSLQGNTPHEQSTLTDVEMSDIDDGTGPHVHQVGDSRRSQKWTDGSDRESESSSSTLHLDLLSPSPSSREAVEQPLPETPDAVPRAMQRTTSELGHVIDRAPLPPPQPHPARRQSHGKDLGHHQDQEQPQPSKSRQDHITDTVGAIAVDCYGNIACGASSGGIGMKYSGRVGPAALGGAGAAVVPAEPEDEDKVSVAAVTSGTGEHITTTMAAAIGADRLYYSVKKSEGGKLQSVTEEEAVRGVIEKDFMGHPSVRNSTSVGAIGLMSVKKTRDGIYFFFAHNTDSFALASMHADEDKPTCTMSRSIGNGVVAQGGRCLRYKRKQ
ncbi:nucleophile aminohydrolase [Macrophomina phaseolina]|uniref:Nucleophile aminohydrolase n=1 Tax=Macrophomina phaseolina TaxID=35725 RepID=A0ABQ8GJ16_9PEZI|nr:nucleophile aminohydrolase [Macrophomina phaseolina]